MNRGTKPTQDGRSGAKRRRIQLSDINGMVLVVAALAATILASGLTEARYLKQEQMDRTAKKSADKHIKLAQCPRTQLPVSHSPMVR